MGKYSDVAIAIRKRDAKRLFDEVAKRPDEDIVKWFVSSKMEEFNINDADPNPDGIQVLPRVLLQSNRRHCNLS